MLLEGSGQQPTAATLPAMMKLLRHMKLAVSADESVPSEKVYCAADLGLLVLHRTADQNGWDTTISFPGQAPLPRQLLRAETGKGSGEGKQPIPASRCARHARPLFTNELKIDKKHVALP